VGIGVVEEEDDDDNDNGFLHAVSISSCPSNDTDSSKVFMLPTNKWPATRSRC